MDDLISSCHVVNIHVTETELVCRLFTFQRLIDLIIISSAAFVSTTQMKE